MATDEPDLTRGMSDSELKFGKNLKGKAASLTAKVNTQGVRNLTNEFSGLLRVLRQVRSEMVSINRVGAAGAGGGASTGVGTPTAMGLSAVGQYSSTGGGGGGGGFGAMVRGFAGGGNFASGPGRGGTALLGAGTVASMGMGVLGNRFDRNMAQSAVIGGQDLLQSTMYGTPYRGAEMARYGSGNNFLGTRESALQAQQIGLGMGMPMANSSRFMSMINSVVQASGGTVSAGQAASMGGQFADPFVSRRAQAMGIQTYKTEGVLNNPLQVGLGYIKDYEKRMGVTMNEIDFSNMRSPGSGTRMRFRQIYGLSDEAIDTAIQAGMQNMQYRSKSGSNINFNSGAQLGQLGLGRQALSLQTAALSSSVGRREARFFQSQEGSMVARQGMEITIQETLADVEDAFSGILGPLYEFEKVIKLVTGGMAILGGMGVLTGGMGGGGGLLGALRGGSSAIGAGPGAAAAGGRLSGMMGGAGMALGGAGLAAAGIPMINSGGTMGTVGGVAAMTAGGAMIGSVIAPGIGTAVGAGIGAAVGTSYAAYKYFKAKDARSVEEGYNDALAMQDEALVGTLGDYAKMAGKGRFAEGVGAGPKQRGRYDAWAARRGALTAAALDEAMAAGLIDVSSGSDAAKVAELVNFFSGTAVFNDGNLRSKVADAKPFLTQLYNTPVYKKYFGSVSDPWDVSSVINTEEAKTLVLSTDQIYSASTAGANGQTGDGAFASGPDPYPRGGDPIDDRASQKGATWDKLHPTMKSRLMAMFKASGGKVWLGNGWRSSDSQRAMFLSRHREDPNGSISYDGKRWRHVSGAAAAPPGRSMHEIGLAADLEGDLSWMNANAAKFGLKHFANVNNEPWHVQPEELPNSRKSYEDGGASWGTGDQPSTPEGTGSTGASAPAASGLMSVGGGGGGASSASGFGYSMMGAMQGVSAPSGGGGLTMSGAGTGASVGSGGSGGASVPLTGNWGGSELERGIEVAKVAYNAGFRGQDLLNMVGIAYRESRWQPNTWVVDSDDHGGGLWGINQLPWLRQGMTPPFSKEDILNPQENANIARRMFTKELPGPGGPYNPWKGYDAPERTFPEKAREAVTAAGLLGTGDGPFDAGGNTTSLAGGHVSVAFDIRINSTGQAGYDAAQLVASVRPGLERVANEVFAKRSS